VKLRELVEKTNLKVCAGGAHLDREVGGGYVSDLLSDVIANSHAGDLWITLQIHENTVAVATLRDLAGILLVGGREPEPPTVTRAEAEGVPILTSPQRSFEVAALLASAGVPRRASP
jgi:predicted transcriptional regulator